MPKEISDLKLRESRYFKNPCDGILYADKEKNSFVIDLGHPYRSWDATKPQPPRLDIHSLRKEITRRVRARDKRGIMKAEKGIMKIEIVQNDVGSNDVVYESRLNVYLRKLVPDITFHLLDVTDEIIKEQNADISEHVGCVGPEIGRYSLESIAVARDDPERNEKVWEYMHSYHKNFYEQLKKIRERLVGLQYACMSERTRFFDVRTAECEESERH